MKLSKRYENQIVRFIKICHKLGNNKYVAGSGGNLAWKLEEDLLLITPTKVNKADITVADLIFMRMDGKVLEGTRQPTGEKPMYLKCFKERRDVVSAIHCHPPYICASSIMRRKTYLMRPYFPEAVIEIGPVPVIPYTKPLSEELAEKLAPFLRTYNSFILQNHGLLSLSSGDIETAFSQVDLLECTTQSILLAIPIDDLHEMSKHDLKNLDHVIQLRKVSLCGAPGVNKSLVDLYYPKRIRRVDVKKRSGR